MIKKARCFLFVLFTPVVLLADYVGFGGKIGITDGWGYDQDRYVSTLQPGLAAGMFVDFKILKFISLSAEIDYNQWQWRDDESDPTDYRYDFIPILFLANFTVPYLKWKPVFSIGPRIDLLANVGGRYRNGTWFNYDLSHNPIFNRYAVGGSIGAGVISPQFYKFDFSFQLFFNSQFTQAGDSPPNPGGSLVGLGGELLVLKCQTINVILSFAFHPFRDKK